MLFLLAQLAEAAMPVTLGLDETADVDGHRLAVSSLVWETLEPAPDGTGGGSSVEVTVGLGRDQQTLKRQAPDWERDQHAYFASGYRVTLTGVSMHPDTVSLEVERLVPDPSPARRQVAQHARVDIAPGYTFSYVLADGVMACEYVAGGQQSFTQRFRLDPVVGASWTWRHLVLTVVSQQSEGLELDVGVGTWR